MVIIENLEVEETNGEELGSKYNITVVNHSLFLECSEICICGHHAKYHKNIGTAGYCQKCRKERKVIGLAVHNFQPKDSRSMPYTVFKDFVEPELNRKEVK